MINPITPETTGATNSPSRAEGIAEALKRAGTTGFKIGAGMINNRSLSSAIIETHLQAVSKGADPKKVHTAFSDGFLAGLEHRNGRYSIPPYDLSTTKITGSL